MDINNYIDNIFKGIDDSIKFDEEQKKAILCETKHQLIIAGAGSGKTTVLAGKVKYLVEIKGIKPEEILMISFTNKATAELIERINKAMNIPCHIKTFHKFGYDIIKDECDEKLRVCTDTNQIIKKISKKREVKKLYCEYYKLKRIKKFEFILNPFHTIPSDRKDEFYNFLNNVIGKYKNKEFYNLKNNKYVDQIKKVVDNYEEKLNENHLIDFSDMIIKAIDIINEITEFDYKYIIIDEYQDISYIRHLLIKTIVNKFNSSLIAVGDDWQSIYAFSGSKVELFTEFLKEYPKAEIMKITKTYRNSQELIDIVGNFVMKNDKQIKKGLISNKHINEPIMFIKYKKSNKIAKLCTALDYLLKEYPNKTILLLGRYKFDIKKFIDDNKIKKINDNKIIYKDSYEIDFMTAHASKGLGYDNVIIINCENGEFGFPSKKTDNDILKNLKLDDDQVNEERRLFYVAMTRTKNKVILLIPNKNESEFIAELKNDLPHVLIGK